MKQFLIPSGCANQHGIEENSWKNSFKQDVDKSKNMFNICRYIFGYDKSITGKRDRQRKETSTQIQNVFYSKIENRTCSLPLTLSLSLPPSPPLYI